MKRFAFAALLTGSLLAQLSIPPPILNNEGVEAMLKQGVPAAIIVQAIMNSQEAQFLVNSYEFGRLTEAGAANLAAEQILDAMHQRMIHPPQRPQVIYATQTAPAPQNEFIPQPQNIEPSQAPMAQPSPINYGPVPQPAPIPSWPIQPGQQDPYGYPSQPAQPAPGPAFRPPGHSIYIEPNEGFESYVSAAIIKKKVNIAIVTDPNLAEFVLLSAPVKSKEESGLSKIARCAYAYCLGINGSQTASIQLIQTINNQIVWAYSVRKGGSNNYQSSAEAIAKHLKEFIPTASLKTIPAAKSSQPRAQP